MKTFSVLQVQNTDRIVPNAWSINEMILWSKPTSSGWCRKKFESSYAQLKLSIQLSNPSHAVHSDIPQSRIFGTSMLSWWGEYKSQSDMSGWTQDGTTSCRAWSVPYFCSMCLYSTFVFERSPFHLQDTVYVELRLVGTLWQHATEWQLTGPVSTNSVQNLTVWHCYLLAPKLSFIWKDVVDCWCAIHTATW
jgi:hypothetical protein